MSGIRREVWGHTRSGGEIVRWTVARGNLSVSLINFGATVQRLVYQGTRGTYDVVASLPEAALYEKFARACFGATVGRYAGRIAGGRFCIDGREVRLTRNQRGNHLHGGKCGLNARLWEGSALGEKEENDGASVMFSCLSPDGEEGYPGNLRVTVRYTVTADDALRITYDAVSDRDTVINLTNHSYFTLNGDSPDGPSTGDDNHSVELTIDADAVLELSDSLPTGRLLPVAGTPFDFRTPKPIARDMDASPETADGYDHTFVLRQPGGDAPVAVAYGTKSGIRMACFTDQPGAQLYTMGNPGGVFALETQHFPDSPHHPSFPDTVLRAGDTFHSETVYRFSSQ
ncbi:MAG: galactose mutarotase [Clostridia bacterium]|nr:galactose mutarotase [Clostridia bacterium]